MTTIFSHAETAITSCVDRIGILLVWMSIYCKHYDAEQTKDTTSAEQFQRQLVIFEKVIKFTEDINNSNLIYDTDRRCFVQLSDQIPDGIFLPNEDRVVFFEECTQSMRESIITILESRGRHFKVFNFDEQVEDVFLIINTLNQKGLTDIATIEMLFGGVASLRNHLEEVIDFFKKEILDD